MNREIKFRGLSINGEWYYGNLAIIKKKVDHIEAGCYISNSAGMPFAYQVRPETVTQFTGLLDKNGKEIYEGDLFRIIDPEDKSTCEIVFKDGAFRKKYWQWEDGLQYPIIDKFDLENFEVIGNIYENPELLKTL